jgi:hypothetical protein
MSNVEGTRMSFGCFNLVLAAGKGYSLNFNTYSVVVENGHLETIKWLSEHECPCNVLIQRVSFSL